MSKEITLSNIEIINSLGAIQRIVQTPDELPIGLSIACYDNIEVLQEHSEVLDNYKEELLDKYAEFDEDGNIKTNDVEKNESGGPVREEIKFQSEEEKEKYVEELNEKYEEEVKLDLETVSKELVEEVEVSPQAAISLSWMFE